MTKGKRHDRDSRRDTTEWKVRQASESVEEMPEGDRYERGNGECMPEVEVTENGCRKVEAVLNSSGRCPR